MAVPQPLLAQQGTLIKLLARVTAVETQTVAAGEQQRRGLLSSEERLQAAFGRSFGDNRGGLPIPPLVQLLPQWLKQMLQADVSGGIVRVPRAEQHGLPRPLRRPGLCVNHAPRIVLIFIESIEMDS